MMAMVMIPVFPDSGDAYTMIAIAADVPMATLAVTAYLVAISNLPSNFICFSALGLEIA